MSEVVMGGVVDDERGNPIRRYASSLPGSTRCQLPVTVKPVTLEASPGRQSVRSARLRLRLPKSQRAVVGRRAGEMDCPRCRAANRHGRRFCGGCGAPLLAECPACGFGNEADERFCGGCGAALGVEPAPLAAVTVVERERRPVSVLFADVVGFTPLS